MEQPENLRREDPVGYWEKRILEWEGRRYGKLARYSLLSYAVFNRRERALQILGRLLATHPEADSILSLGCGSGLLAERLEPARALSYHGIDSSAPAIARARGRRYHQNLSATFECANLAAKALPPAKIAVALGLFDWLPDAAIAGALSALSARHLLVSFSDEKRRLLGGAFSLYHRRRTLPGLAGCYPRVFPYENILGQLSRHGYQVVERHGGIGLGIGNILVAERDSNGNRAQH